LDFYVYQLCGSEIQLVCLRRTLFNYGDMHEKFFLSQKPKTCLNNQLNDTGTCGPLVIE